MIHIAIVDDEQQWQEKAIETIKKYWDEIYEIDTFSDGVAFLNSQKEYQIVFMDVELEDEDGFEIYASYQKNHKNTILIMFTTHTEFSRKGYQYDAFRYIDKTQLDEMEETVQALKKKLVQENSIELQTVDGNIGYIQIRKIVYVEAQGRNVRVVTNEGSFVCKEKITVMEERLRDMGFFLIHRSYLVNMDWVKKHDIRQLELTNDEKIYVSRRRYTEFRQELFRWKLERGNG